MTRFQGKLDSEFELFLTIPGVVQLLFKFHGQAMIGWSTSDVAYVECFCPNQLTAFDVG
jgi:hypothetical protein